MRPVHLNVMCFLFVMKSVQGSRLGKLEDQVNDLKSFIYKELGYIRDEVKDISNRVEVLENDPQKPSAHIQERLSTTNSLRDEVRGNDNKPNHIVIAEMGNIRKAFSKDKKDLHKLKQDVKGQLRELEEKIDTHLESLTSEVQQNIKYIHQNISSGNVSLLDVVNESISYVSNFSDNLRIKMAEYAANTSEQLALRLNETEIKMKQNITITYRQSEDKLQSFMALADRNISEIILKAEHIISLIRTNISEVPTQIANVSLGLDSVKQKIVENPKQITRAMTCSKIQDGYYYPCEEKDIRLANASSYLSNGVQGRLEVRHNDIWGTVCDDSFNFNNPNTGNNVNVTCAMFGFGECDFVREAGLGEGSGTIWMNEMECDGGESSFMDCPHRGWGVDNCSHSEDVGFRMWK